MTTKIDLINGAFSLGRISGLTVQATPEDITLALRRLENLMAEWADQNICLNYNFETNPDPNSTHNISKKYVNAVESNLMTRMLPDFGREPTAALSSIARTSYSRMASSLAVVPLVDYPSRQPRGSGNNRWNQFDRYFRPIESAPIECKTVQMVVGDIDNFYEDYAAYLNSGESILTYSLTSDDALTISNLPNLAIGTTKTAVSNVAFTYVISGTTYAKAAVVAGTAPGNDVIPQSTYGAVAFDIDSAGTITAVEASANATGYGSAVLAIAGISDVASTKFRMGTVTATKSDGAFTFGTTDLDAANSSVSYTDTNISGTRIIYTVTATGVSSTEVAAVYQVKIIATTSDGRIETRLRNFELTDVEIG